ncbi:MAG TPA: TspO/MBR family protein [Thermomicrobiales bacterium]|nr:TspO/MBR family protein [Thermomicrobiales bacterium]
MNWPRLIGSIAACQAAGGVGAIATSDGLKDWYPSLRKPSFNPPGSVFGPVWTTLYLLMGTAEYIVSQYDGDEAVKRRAQSLFALQLGMNVGWSFLFFKLKSPLAALIELIALLGAIIATIAAFARISRLAAALLIPYLLWSTFAAILNASIWRLNR